MARPFRTVIVNPGKNKLWKRLALTGRNGYSKTYLTPSQRAQALRGPGKQGTKRAPLRSLSDSKLHNLGMSNEDIAYIKSLPKSVKKLTARGKAKRGYRIKAQQRFQAASSKGIKYKGLLAATRQISFAEAGARKVARKAARNAAKKNPRKRRFGKAKRQPLKLNPAIRNPMGLAKMVNKIPVLGGILSPAVAAAPMAAIGAVAIELPLQLASIISDKIGDKVPAFLMGKAYFPIMSSILAGVVYKFAPVDRATRQQAALAIASAGFGVGYYQMRHEQICEKAGVTTPEQAVDPEATTAGLGALMTMGGLEYGGLETNMGALSYDGLEYSGAPAYRVQPAGRIGVSI